MQEIWGTRHQKVDNPKKTLLSKDKITKKQDHLNSIMKMTVHNEYLYYENEILPADRLAKI